MPNDFTVDARTVDARVAVLETKVNQLETEAASLRSFKEEMIVQLTQLKSDIKALNWKMSMYTGAVVVVLNQIASWGLKHILP